MRGKYIVLSIVALAAATGIGVGTAFYQNRTLSAAKNVTSPHENLQSFVQTANNWLTARQKSSAWSLHMANTQSGWRTDGQNIYHTADGGKNWSAAAPFYDGQAVDFQDASHAVALAKAVKEEEALTGISVYSTSDSGTAWHRLVLSGSSIFGTDSIMRGVDGLSMADNRNGLLILAGDPAAGHHESTVLSTNDDGHSFQKQTDTLRVLNGQTALAAADAKHAYLFVNGSPAPVFMTATTDGGKSWTEQDSGLTTKYTDITPSYVPIRMTSDSRVALLSVQNSAAAPSSSKKQAETADTRMRNTFYTLSEDGSVSGKLAELLTELPLDAKSVSMPDAQTIYVLSQAGGKPVLYRFAAQGGWTRINSSTLPDGGLQIQFVDPSHGYILQKDAVWQTSDGGKSWGKSLF